jgi:hypothetical protein
MAKKSQESPKEGKTFQKEDKQRTLLERLGFVQMVFDFYAAPVR